MQRYGLQTWDAFLQDFMRHWPTADPHTYFDEHDAWSVAAWLQEADRRGTLVQYFAPPLTLPEKKQAKLEGWILGGW